MKRRAESTPRNVTNVTEPRQITLRWGAIVAGLVLAYAVSVVAGATLARTGNEGNLNLFVAIQFVALFAGGYLAGRMARVAGFMNGVTVAVVFIVVWAVQNAIWEAQLVQQYGPLALPRMNMAGIILGDTLNLTAAAFGGWLSEKKGS